MKKSWKEITEALIEELAPLCFSPPVAYTYNPLVYAREAYDLYVARFGQGNKKTLFLGMNPGPFGMAQTGVPFGEIAAVRDWMGLECAVGKPEAEHPKRPIEGFACSRSEVSGRRLWGLFEELYGTAEAFFEENFVSNYCPLVWMSGTGGNLTPDKLKKEERALVEKACLKALVAQIELLEPEFLVGVGAYAEKKLKEAALLLPEKKFILGALLHPSPASPLANREWDTLPKKQLAELYAFRQ